MVLAGAQQESARAQFDKPPGVVVWYSVTQTTSESIVKIMTQRFRDICFTSFREEAPEMHNSLTYLVYQREKCPKTGKEHWQGFCQAKNQKASFKAWQKAIGDPKAHIEKRHGTATEARDYCMAAEWKGKSKGQIPDSTKEFGEFDPKENEGKRNDLEEARKTILGKRRWADVVNDPEVQPVLAKHLNWAKTVFNNKPPAKMKELEWRPWQKDLLEIATKECDDNRTIHWYYDPECGAGKTTITKFLVRNHNAVVLSGKTADVLHGYDDQEICIFDIPKDAQNGDKDFIPYGAIEKIKDGTFFSGKYEGRMHVRDFECHVIVFANCLPKEGCWDPTRTNLIELSERDAPQFA